MYQISLLAEEGVKLAKLGDVGQQGSLGPKTPSLRSGLLGEAEVYELTRDVATLTGSYFDRTKLFKSDKINYS